MSVLTKTHSSTIIGHVGPRLEERVIADSSFDFTACLQHRLADENAYSQLFSLSPLSSPCLTPSPSPRLITNPILPYVDDDNQRASQSTASEYTQPPTTSPMPCLSVQSTSAPRQHVNSTEKRKAKLKKASKTRRDRDRNIQKASVAFGAYKITSALVCRHVEGSEHIVCDTDASQLKNVASTGFVGLNDQRRSKAVYTLEQLVGRDSRFKFRLHRWDGRFVPPCSQKLHTAHLDF